MQTPSIHEITKGYLDNADVKLKISENAGRVELDFIVFGEVNQKYWRIFFECKRILDFHITKDIDKDGADDYSFPVVKTNVTQRNVNTLEDRIREVCQVADPVWQISIYGGVYIDIYCLEFEWYITNLKKDDYLKLINGQTVN